MSRAVNQRTRISSWRTFERRFQPIDREPGTVWWEHEHRRASIDEHFVWTIVLKARLRYDANRLMYLVCAMPWTDAVVAAGALRYGVGQPDYRYD